MHAARKLAVFVAVGIVWGCTAGLALGQSNWSGSTAPQSSNFDRYTQPINSAAATISQQTQNAATNATTSAGNTLRDGIDAGFRAAEQSMNSALGQLQSPTSTNGGQSTAGSATRGNVASPWPTTSNSAPAAQSWSSNSSVPATNRGTAAAPASGGNGWSSIGTNVAAPPLIIPQTPMASPNYNGAAAGTVGGTTTAVTANRNGNVLPAPPANDPQSMHSMLTDTAKSPASPANVSAPDWTKSWNNNSSASPATISRTNNQTTLGTTGQDSNLVPVQGSSFDQSDPRATNTARPNDSNLFGSWNNQSQPQAPAVESTANRPAVNPNLAGPQLNGPLNNSPTGQYTNNTNLPSGQTGQFPNAAGAQSWNQTNGQFASQPNGQMPNGQQYSSYPPGNVNATTGQMPQGQMNNGLPANNQLGAGANGTQQTPAGVHNPDQTWVPMVLAVIGLAMSFAANLYLGASYLDARQKYQSLVRKTADTFRRVSAAA